VWEGLRSPRWIFLLTKYATTSVQRPTNGGVLREYIIYTIAILRLYESAHCLSDFCYSTCVRLLRPHSQRRLCFHFHSRICRPHHCLVDGLMAGSNTVGPHLRPMFRCIGLRLPHNFGVSSSSYHLRHISCEQGFYQGRLPAYRICDIYLHFLILYLNTHYFLRIDFLLSSPSSSVFGNPGSPLTSCGLDSVGT